MWVMTSPWIQGSSAPCGFPSPAVLPLGTIVRPQPVRVPVKVEIALRWVVWRGAAWLQPDHVADMQLTRRGDADAQLAANLLIPAKGVGCVAPRDVRSEERRVG